MTEKKVEKKENIIKGECEEVKENKKELITQAVSITAKQLEMQVKKDEEFRKVLTNFISRNLKEGVDTYTLTIKGRVSKPSLSKAGSEKFCSLMKIRPIFRKDSETWEMLGSTFGILCYICELVDTRGRIVGEGRGTFKVDIKGLDFDINKGVKNAQKRAQVDAVLRTGSLSDYFTQDLEDMPKESINKTDEKTNTLSKNCSKCGGIMFYHEGKGKKSGKDFKMWKCEKCEDIEWVTFPKKDRQEQEYEPKSEAERKFIKEMEEYNEKPADEMVENDTTPEDLKGQG